MLVPHNIRITSHHSRAVYMKHENASSAAFTGLKGTFNKFSEKRTPFSSENT